MIKSHLVVVISLAMASVSAQGTCELLIENGMLTGNCENSYFTYFEINVDLDELDSIGIFNSLPTKGFLRLNNGPKVGVKYELTIRAGFEQILIKSRAGWFTMDSLLISDRSLRFTIDHDPNVPVTDSDLLIIRKTMELLKNQSSWHKQDDRDCKDDEENQVYSLFCALQKASIFIEGEYNHRNAIMQKTRHHIVKMFPDKQWKHRLRDFNNMPETNFEVLTELLIKIEAEVEDELTQKK